MSRVRVLVGTRKGAFILTSDGKRENWEVSGPHFGGWEIYHLKGSPGRSEPDLRLAVERLVRPDDPALQRRRQDLGAGRQQVRLRRRARHAPVVRRHAASVGVQARLASRAVADRSRHGLRRRRGRRAVPLDRRRPDAGTSCPACAATTRAALAAGRRRHVPAHDPARSARTRSGSSSPSRPPARSAPTTPARPGGRSIAGSTPSSIPNPTAEVGHCVHRIAMHPSRPDVLFMQKHWDVMRSDDAGDSWHEVSGNLPTDFGFPIDVHAHEPETIYVVPIKSDSEHYPPDGKLRVYRSRTGGNEWEALTNGLPQSDCYVNVLRDAMAVDSLDPCGVYFGTTGGQVYASADAGDSWAPIVRDLPAVLSVEVQTLPMIRVVLPAHLRTLARVDGEVQLEVDGPATQRSVLDALEARYPMLRGTIRDHVTPAAPAVRAVLRLRAGSVARVARCAAARGGRRRAPSRFWSSARWPAARKATEENRMTYVPLDRPGAARRPLPVRGGDEADSAPRQDDWTRAGAWPVSALHRSVRDTGRARSDPSRSLPHPPGPDAARRGRARHHHARGRPCSTSGAAISSPPE